MAGGKKKNNGKKQNAGDDKKKSREASRKAAQDLEDHNFLDAKIQEKKQAAASLQMELESKMSITWHSEFNLSSAFKNMPKVELHAHLSGSLSEETIKKIRDAAGKDTKAQKDTADYKLSMPKDMKEVFDHFTVANELLEKEENLRMATLETIEDFARDNCVYLELRTGPKNTAYMTKEQYLRTVIKAIVDAREKFKQMKIFLIVSFNRTLTFEEAAELLHLVGILQLESNVIVGVELSGDPTVSGHHLHQIFQIARRFHGLGVTLHLAEVASQTTDVLDYLMLMPDRIGHGTFLTNNSKYREMMDFYKFPLEICLSSNIYTKTTTSLDQSHFDYWRKKGCPVAICTDDKGVIPGCSLSEEYYKAAAAFRLSTADMIKINVDALKASFAYKYNLIDLTDTFRKLRNNTIH